MHLSDLTNSEFLNPNSYPRGRGHEARGYEPIRTFSIRVPSDKN